MSDRKKPLAAPVAVYCPHPPPPPPPSPPPPPFEVDCLLVETTAPVKLLVPTFGFCTPARCQTGGFPPIACPPSPLFPPQCAPPTD